MSLTKERGCPSGQIMALLGALWLGFFPLWQDGSYTRITRVKWLGMLVLTGVTAALIVGLVVWTLMKRQRRSVRLHPVQGLALAYLGWLALSALFGSMADSVNGAGQLTVLMGARRYEGLVTQSCYIAIFLMMSLYPANLRRVMNAAALGMLIYGAIVALQYAGFNPFGLFPGGLSVRTNYEFQGTLGNIDMVSGYVCLLMPALLFSYALLGTGLLCLLAGEVGVLLLLLIEVQSGLIALALALAALALVALLRPETRCRGCVVLACALVTLSLRLLLGLPWHDGTERILFPHAVALWKLAPLALAALLALMAGRLSHRPGRAISGRWVLALAALGMVVVMLAVLLLPFPEGSGLWELKEILRGRPQDSFGSERLGIWRLTLEMARENLLFGTGPDTFWYAMAQYQAETEQGLIQRFDNPHNILLSVLSGSGLPALLLYLALLAAVAVMCLRSSRKDAWPLALLAGLVAYQVQGLFTFSLCLVSPMFWAMLGMAVSQSCRREE